MDFHEAFSNLVINEELERAFNDISVEKVIVSKRSGKITIIVSGITPVRRGHIVSMQDVLMKQIFTSREQTVFIEERYDLSDFSIRNIFEKNKSAILEELAEQGRIYYNILNNSKIDFDETSIYIESEDNFIIREKLVKISDWMKTVFTKRFNKEVSIKLSFSKSQKSDKNDKDIYTIDEILKSRPKSEQTAVVKAESKSETKNYSKKNYKSDGFYKKKPQSNDPAMIYGRNFEGAYIKLNDVTEPQKDLIVRGKIVSLDEKETKTGKIILSFTITDFTDSITCKIWADSENKEELKEKLAPGKFIKINADAQDDTYAGELTLGFANGIKEIPDFTVKRKDNSDKKRVELHLHTNMSEMDAVIKPDKLLKTLSEWGHKAIAVTDHGVVQGFTNMLHAKEKLKMNDFKLIYGMEGYVVDDVSPAVRMDKGQKLTDSAVIFDIETTGFGPKNCRIIEIGAVKVENGRVVDEFSYFVNPKQSIPEEITKLTSITQEMVINEPEIDIILI